jgi:hypothetical protein
MKYIAKENFCGVSIAMSVGEVQEVPDTVAASLEAAGYIEPVEKKAPAKEKSKK